MVAPILLAALAVVYRVNPAQSEAGFDLKATMHTVHGKTTRVTGEVTAVDEGDGTLALTGRIEVNAASLDTGNDSRDKKMHGESLDVARHPLIVLVPARFVPKGPEATDGTREGTLSGTLSIRGVGRPVDIALTLRPAGPRMIAEGTFDVSWSDFGVPDPSFAFVRIQKIALARFKAEFAVVPP